MKEYLDKEKVMETIREAPFSRSMCMTQEECNGAKMAQNVIARLVDETIPVAKIEPILRCKDCQHNAQPTERGFAQCEIDALCRDPDFYCANAVRRAE